MKTLLVCSLLSFLCSFIAAQQSIYGLHVVKNQVLNGQGQVIRLLGASRSGAEFACVQGWGIFDGPTDNTSIAAIKSWNINVIRIPLNEDCWLGINGVNPLYSGPNYQSAIIDFVNRLNAYGIAVILDLHWTAPGTNVPYGQQPMPNIDHDIDFWKSVAATFSSNSAVIFDLFNEPYPDNNQDTSAAWSCMANGGSCNGVWYNAASMQNLVDAVRSTNATNIVLVAGVEYANCLTQWLANMPKDPLNQLGASWHSYSFNICNNQACWDSQIKPVALQVPVFVTEFGENDCSTGYVNPLMNWMDTLGLSYLGWTWNVWDCSSGPALISNYDGTPTNYGQGLYQHLKSLFASSSTHSVDATPSPSPSSNTTVCCRYVEDDDPAQLLCTCFNNDCPAFPGVHLDFNVTVSNCAECMNICAF